MLGTMSFKILVFKIYAIYCYYFILKVKIIDSKI